MFFVPGMTLALPYFLGWWAVSSSFWELHFTLWRSTESSFLRGTENLSHSLYHCFTSTMTVISISVCTAQSCTPTVEEHTWTLVPEAEACTRATTDPPGSTDLTWARDDLAAPGSQRSLRRRQRKTQTGTHSCESFCQVAGIYQVYIWHYNPATALNAVTFTLLHGWNSGWIFGLGLVWTVTSLHAYLMLCCSQQFMFVCECSETHTNTHGFGRFNAAPVYLTHSHAAF